MADSFTDDGDGVGSHPATTAPRARNSTPLLDDPNDDFCRVCGYGVMLCETHSILWIIAATLLTSCCYVSQICHYGYILSLNKRPGCVLLEHVYLHECNAWHLAAGLPA